MALNTGNVIISGYWNSNTATILGVWYANIVGSSSTAGTLNYGIQFGTDSLPSGYPEFAALMGGPVSGVNTTSDPPQPGGKGSKIYASVLTSAFLSSIRLWGSIRQATFYYAILGGDTTVVGSGITYLNSSYNITVPAPTPNGPSKGQIIVGSGGGIPGPTTLSYVSPGSYSFTVPTGIHSLSINILGGGGGAGGSDASGQGHDGYPGAVISGALTVNPGDTIDIIVGGGGVGGTNQASGSGGGAGGSSGSGHGGGTGGNAGGSGSSGGGGGGGGASIVYINGSLAALAAGGGGGGGASNGPYGQDQDPAHTNGTSINGQNRSGDGGGGGGGGGGNPSGYGGQSSTGDGSNGGWSGLNGVSTASGFSLTTGTNGGAHNGGLGGSGAVVVNYVIDASTYSIESYFQALYNSYINNVRNNTASATITVCHSSCHSSCHGSRGRR